jgi:hypothetical protein
VDAHLVLNKVQLGKRYVQLTGREEHVSLHLVSVEVTGDARLTLAGCDAFRWVVTGGGDARGGGARCSLASRVLNVASSLFSVSLVTWVASTWSLSHFSMFWSHSVSIVNESTTSTTCYGGGAGGNRW